MGTIKPFNPAELQARYGLVNFVETGLGWGDSVRLALELPFTAVYSCEIDSETFANTMGTLPTDPRLTVYASDSVHFLTKVVPTLCGPTLWFLDAHFPGCYRTGTLNFDDPNATPLLSEVLLIADARDITQDVFILDDMGLYMPGVCDQGDLPMLRTTKMPQGHIEQIMTRLAPTHDLTPLTWDQGYMLVTPKGR